MQTAILKKKWERFSAHVELDRDIICSLIEPVSALAIKSCTILSEGCANSNYKICFDGDHDPVVLRLYIREKSALAREKALTNLLYDKLPMAQLLYSDDSCSLIEYPYAIFSWVDGVMMRDVIMRGDQDEISQCAFDAGKKLNVLQNIEFDQGGFFQDDFSIRPFADDEKYIPYVTSMLHEKNVTDSLSKDTVSQLEQLIKRHEQDIPDINPANLVHGDYDPANILVQKIDHQWQISAILDWEFAFAGSYYLDIGMFLRFAHRIDPCYESSFIEGYCTNGAPLSPSWKQSAKLMDIICLLQLLHYNPAELRPNMNQDLQLLVQNTVNYLSQLDFLEEK